MSTGWIELRCGCDEALPEAIAQNFELTVAQAAPCGGGLHADVMTNALRLCPCPVTRSAPGWGKAK